MSRKMKTSNKILVAAGALFLAFATIQIIDGMCQVRQTRSLLRPILEEINQREIKVIRMVRSNDNYVVKDIDSESEWSYILFRHCKPDASSLRIDGDTLTIAHEGRIIVYIPSATQVIEWDGTIRELKAQEE
jgi:hypothetical protein